MTIPSQTDLNKREQKLKGFLKNLDKDGKTKEVRAIGAVRSAIRQAWMKSDTKLAYLYMNTIPDMDDSTRSKWLFKCEICGDLFKLADIEVDHKSGNHPFTKVEEFENYFENILMVGFDGLQILCKDDHDTKTLMESIGCTWGEALAHKQAIEIIKSKKDKEWLEERNIKPASNQKARRAQILEVLKNER